MENRAIPLISLEKAGFNELAMSLAGIPTVANEVGLALSWPRRIGINRAPNHVHDLSHSARGEHRPLRVKQRLLL